MPASLADGPRDRLCDHGRRLRNRDRRLRLGHIRILSRRREGCDPAGSAQSHERQIVIVRALLCHECVRISVSVRVYARL